VKSLLEENYLSGFGSFTLTSHRIRQGKGYNRKRQRVREVASIRLEHITHCQITSIERPSLLVIGFLLIVAGCIGARINPALFLLGVVCGLALIISYFTDRHSEIEIASSSVILSERLPKASLEKAMDFVQVVEQAAVIRSDLPRGSTQPWERAEADYWGG
jgi:hypothetical protein